MAEDCQDALRQLQTYLDGECEQELEAAIRAHLDDCPPCGDRVSFEQRLRELVQRTCHETAPPGLVERVMACLPVTEPGSGADA